MFTDLKDIYPDPTILKTKQSLLAQSISKFKSNFGGSPTHIARAPGRVNIIGEHIDYNGFGVLPFAIHKDITISFRLNNEGVLRMRNSNSERFLDKEFGVDFESWQTDKGDWSGYLLWGFKAIVHLVQSKGRSL